MRRWPLFLLPCLVVACSSEVTPSDAGGDGGPVRDVVPLADTVTPQDGPNAVHTAALLASCGPTDGPTYELIISTREDAIACSFASAGVDTFVLTLPGSLPTGPGNYMVTGVLYTSCSTGVCSTAAQGTVTYESYDPMGSAIVGTYALALADGSTRSGLYGATICSNPRTCG